MNHPRQQGFTLIEISIVLVIIGLLTGAVLKGQQMIENARYKSFVQEINAYRTAVYAFQDQYKYLPGDYPNAAGRLKAGGTALPGGNGDGSMGNGVSTGGNCNVKDEETCLFWRHLIAAGLISGDATQSAPEKLWRPLDVGGVVSSVASGAYSGEASLVFFINSIPGEPAQRYDEEFDDGAANSGTVVKYIGGSAQNSGDLSAVPDSLC